MFDFSKAISLLTKFPTKPKRITTFDWESTGLHLHHGDMPFMLCTFFDDKSSLLWEADVNPFTRQPQWLASDLLEIEDYFCHNDACQPDDQWEYVASNAKFDVGCSVRLLSPEDSRGADLGTRYLPFDGAEFLKGCHDTIHEHHAIVNNESHALKDAAIKHLGILDSDETELHEAVKEARVIARRLGFKIASKENCPQQRRAPKKGWAVMDMWVPRAVAKWEWEHSAAYQYIRHLPCQKISTQPQLLIAKNKQGWEWHPPEVHSAGVHLWWTLCAKYCHLDCVRSFYLHRKFSAALKQENLWDNYMENRTCLPISYLTENRGLTINLTKCKELIKQFEVERAQAEIAVCGSLNLPGFKVNSSDAIRSVFYGYFKLPVTRLTKPKKKGSVGKPTTDADFVASVVRDCRDNLLQIGVTLEDIAPPVWHKDVEPYRIFKPRLDAWYRGLVAEEKPSVEQLLAFSTALMRYKKANTAIKYLTGYVASAKPLPPKPKAQQPPLNLHVAGTDGSSTTQNDLGPWLDEYGYLFPSLNGVGTKSTRYAGSNPNPQNVSKGGKGKKGLEWLVTKQFSLRSVFGPAAGREWWCFDYHQIQLVIFAMLSGDEKMQQAAHDGKDFHTFMAQAIFGADFDPDEESDRHKWQRDIAKTVNFAFIFGAREQKLNRTAGMPGLYEILQNLFPVAVDFLEKTEWEVRRTGKVYTPGGYQLYVPTDQAYAGVNYMIQGSEGEIVKRAQAGIQVWLDKVLSDPLLMYMTLYVHDELVFDAAAGYGIQQAGNIVRIMNDAAMSFGMPAKAEAKLCRDNWSAGKKLILTGV